MAQLGLTVGDEIRFNVCEVGVAVGLPRRTVREYLLEGVAIEDSAQLEALVSLYMEKTQDAGRLLSRVAELSPQCKSWPIQSREIHFGLKLRFCLIHNFLVLIFF